MEYLIILSWGLFVIAVAGALFNAKKMAIGFVLWTISNIGWAWYNFLRGDFAQGSQNIVFLAVTWYGLWEWRVKDVVLAWWEGTKTEGTEDGLNPLNG